MTRSPLMRWITTSTRLLGGAIAAVVVVIAVIVAVAFPWPTVARAPVAVDATPAPAESSLTCDGPLLALARVVEDAASLSIAADQTVVSGPREAQASERALSGPGDAAPASFTVTPDDGAAPLYAGAGSASVESADLRGFAASACRQPLLESWLVGGATTTGASDLVVLSNPGTVPASVRLLVYGASGPVTAPGADRVVPAGRQVVVPLAGLLPSEQSPVVRVTATGAPVVASLQSSLVRTLVAGGVDRVSPAAEASTRQVIPGVSATAFGADAPDVGALTRLLAPGEDTTAEVTLRDSEGREAGAPVSVPLAAGVPRELELAVPETGVYSVTVTADAAVVAGVWSTTGFAEGADFAWFAAAPEVTLPSAFAVPAGAGAALTLVAGAEETTVTVTDPAGQSDEVTVPADAAVQVPTPRAGVYEMQPSAAVYAAVSFSAAGAVAGYPVWGADATAAPVTVLP
ncbi:DUF5719 family protein [Microbacterium sp. RD1]|uniref:DUF5719 family protein n=1 Tax=Microbacterium sp. RD1 TaxID=3457313 RepID=UPI003FA5563C